jgi:CBS domain containing-hemolysin-like protein
MPLLVFTICLTLFVSFLCSLCEAMILGTTYGETESLKERHPREGAAFERLKARQDETVTAILTLNTIANTFGSALVGGLAMRLYNDAALGAVAGAMTLGILIFAEVIPKKLGAVHRLRLHLPTVYPLVFITFILRPVTYCCNLIVRLFVQHPVATDDADDEIRLLAERGARHGTLSASESSIIANTLRLDDVRVSAIMTPRSVVGALRKNSTIGDVFRDFPNLHFGRMPLYGRNLDEIVGLCRRRDLLKAKAHDLDSDTLEKHMQEVHFIPETVTVADALQVFLKSHQKLLVVVDEFGSTAGVLSLEDVMETILGREIFEKDDMAVDMRELARTRQQRPAGRIRPGQSQPPPAPAAAGPSGATATPPTPPSPAQPKR